MTHLLQSKIKPRHSVSFYENMSYNHPPYWMALNWHDDGVLEQMIESGKYNLNIPEKYSGKTLLMRLVEKGKLNLVKKVLEANTDLSMRDRNGKSALDYARTMLNTYPADKTTTADVLKYAGTKEDYYQIYYCVKTYTIYQRKNNSHRLAAKVILSLTPKKYKHQVARSLQKQK